MLSKLTIGFRDRKSKFSLEIKKCCQIDRDWTSDLTSDHYQPAMESARCGYYKTLSSEFSHNIYLLLFADCYLRSGWVVPSTLSHSWICFPDTQQILTCSRSLSPAKVALKTRIRKRFICSWQSSQHTTVLSWLQACSSCSSNLNMRKELTHFSISEIKNKLLY